MSDVLVQLSRIAAATSVQEVWTVVSGHLRTRGFSRVNYGFTRYRRDRSIGAPEDVLFLTTCDPSYAAHYFRGGFYARTPVYRWASTHVGVCTWRWVEEDFLAGRLSKDEAEAVRINRAMGIVAGISISFPETSVRSKGAMGIIADPGMDHDAVDRFWADQGDQVQALCQMAHLKMTSLPLPTARRPLTDRQREALEWVADGKTTQDIALLMGVSTAMVEKHLRLAREALDVQTTAHAVAKAAMLNQIFVQVGEPAGQLAAAQNAR